MIDMACASDGATAGLVSKPTTTEAFDIGFMVKTTCYGADGSVKWEDETHNLVTTAGKNDMLTQYFKGSAYTAAWYVGLKDAGTVSVADIMLLHSGWTEDTTYSQGTRPSLVLGSASSGSIDNSASRAIFSMTGTTTIAGCFVVNNNTVGGTSGTLYNAVDFSSGSRAVLNGDTLAVQLTLTLS